jgi:hypothetical protein
MVTGSLHHRDREEGNGTVRALLTGVRPEVGVQFDFHLWQTLRGDTDLQ